MTAPSVRELHAALERARDAAGADVSVSPIDTPPGWCPPDCAAPSCADGPPHQAEWCTWWITVESELCAMVADPENAMRECTWWHCEHGLPSVHAAVAGLADLVAWGLDVPGVAW